MINWNKYDPNHSPAGLEVRWLIKDQKLYIEIPGTNSLWDWKTDIFDAFKRTKKFDGSKFHPGFFQYALDFYSYIKPIVKANGIKLIIITAHSMGAAVAYILYRFFNYKKYVCEYPRLYAAPRMMKDGKYTTIANPGELAVYWPLWYKRPVIQWTIKKKQNFIKAHEYDWPFKEEEIV